MMLAPTLTGDGPQTALRKPWLSTRHLVLDGALLAAALGVCAMMLFQGGLEAVIGAGVGALMGARQAPQHSVSRSAISGAFAGLFVGAFFAGFFHDAIARVIAAF
jgi:hypothetical protein